MTQNKPLLCLHAIFLSYLPFQTSTSASFESRQDNNNNHWQEQTAELEFRSCWPWQRLEVYSSYSEMFKAVGERIALSVYASLFLAQVQGGDMPPFSSWVEPVATLDLALIVNYLTSSGISFCCFIGLGFRRSLPISNNFLKKKQSSNRYCAPVEIWNDLCCGSLGMHIRQHLFWCFVLIYFSFLFFILFRIICLNKIVWFSKYFFLTFKQGCTTF